MTSTGTPGEPMTVQSPPGLEGEPYEDANQDQLENDDIKIRQTSLYIPVKGSALSGKTQSEIAMGLEVSNPAEILPNFINMFSRIGKLFVKLTFASKAIRDTVYEGDFYFNGILLHPELPRAENRGLTIYIDGIPLQASDDYVTQWLKSNFGAELVEGTNIKYVGVEGCKVIKSTTRSAVVKLPPHRKIPGFALMRSRSGETAKIRIRYRNSPIWCRKCFGEGHKMENCKIGGWARSRNNPPKPPAEIPPPPLQTPNISGQDGGHFPPLSQKQNENMTSP